MNEPPDKRVSVFVDGQNLFHSVKKAFGYTYPNYNVKKLACEVCEKQGWSNPVSIHFYTGIQSKERSPEWNAFWRRKLDAMKEEGVLVFSRTLFYSRTRIGSGESSEWHWLGREKGVDVRLALDVVKAVYEGSCDVVIIFSQDQDFSEVAKEVRHISKKRDRWIRMVSAFPAGNTSNNKGIASTDWIEIDRETYDGCIDPKNYRLSAGGKI